MPSEQEIERVVFKVLARWFDIDPDDQERRREIRDAVEALVKRRRRRQARAAAVPAELIKAGCALIGSAVVAWLTAQWNGVRL